MSDVDDVVRPLWLGQFYRLFPPRLIPPQTEQPVIQVITRRDRREHLLHAPSLVRDGVGVLQEIIVPGGGFGLGHFPRSQVRV